MKSTLRTGVAVVAILIASYGAVAAGSEAATAAIGHRIATPTGFVTSLPGPIHDVLVDDLHQQVFLTSFDTVTVTDLDGHVMRSITGIGRVREMTLAPDGSTVYLSQPNNQAISAIDTQTHEVTRFPLPANTCSWAPAYVDGKVWFSYRSCQASEVAYGVASLDPGTGAVTKRIDTTKLVTLRALPNRPDRLVAFEPYGSYWVYDVANDPPEIVAASPTDGTRKRCRDAALISGGEQVVTACGNLSVHEVLETADLSRVDAIRTGPSPTSVGISPDGRYLAAGVWAVDGCDVFARDIGGGTPGDFVSSYDIGSFLTPGTLAYSATGRLYAVNGKEGGGSLLHVLTEPAKCPTRFTFVETPSTVAVRNTVTGTGSLLHEPGVSTQASLTRTDRLGTHDLGLIEVAPDGTFSFTDRPRVTGSISYDIEYAGDENYGPGAGGTRWIRVRPPYDIDGGATAEAVMGAPGEDLGSRRDAGMFHVLAGARDGLSGRDSLAIHQDTPGVPGSAESGDRFGYSDASGDFNGDGFADVAVSAPYENIGSARDGGTVWIFYGSASGPRTDRVATIGVDDTHLGSGAERVYFGQSLAAGDFNGDGSDDLAIGAPGASQVFVAHGGSDGLSGADLQDVNEDTAVVPGGFSRAGRFGSSLAVGDVNGDGRDDLAVGAPYDSEDTGWATGSVTLLYADEDGLTGTGAQRWSKETAGVPGSAGADSDSEWSDQFGRHVALADYNGDGKADLAVGAPGAPVTVGGVRKRDAGTVTVLYSDGAKISPSGGEEVTQQTPGMPGVSGHVDRLGLTLTAGDANGDGIAELAAYSPGDTYVTVVPGGSSGLAYGSAKGWTQNSAGIPGGTEAGDGWGDSLRFADVQGTGYHALIVGAPGENSGAGAITVIYSTSSGLTGTGAKYLSQNSSGIPGTAESGDAFGTFH